VQVGDMVQLLDVHGEPHQLFGVILGFNKHGSVRVHWQNGVNYPDASWGPGRLKVINASR